MATFCCEKFVNFMESLVIDFKWSLPEVVELAFHGIFKVYFKISAIATFVLIT